MSAPTLIGALPPETRLHEYLIERVLGHGGFGITYLAQDTLLDKMVAIKEYLPNELAARAEGDTVSIRSDDTRVAFEWGLNNFVKEAKVLARFSHPNLIQVHRFFELNGTAYFVMEYAEGTTLASALKADGALDEERLRAVLLPIALGLEQVHEKGVLHRDIKPDNILLRADGSPVLIDFGAARQNFGTGTMSVMSVVTAGYAPLEQYGTSGTQGPWTDVYALGAVAYRCVVGKKPADAVNRLGTDPVVPAVDMGGDRYSRHVLTAIDWALSVNAEDRPQSISQWRDAFEGNTLAPERSRPAVAQVEATETFPQMAESAELEKTELIRKPASGAAALWKKVAFPEGSAAPWKKYALPGVAGILVILGLLLTLGRAPSLAPVPAPVGELASTTDVESTEDTKETSVVETVESGKSGAEIIEDKTGDAALPAAGPKTASKPTPTPAPASTGTPTPSARPKVVQTVAPPSPPKQITVAEHAPGATFQDCVACPIMAVLPAGTFKMGSAPKTPGAPKWEMPEHTVILKRPIAIGWFEVTVKEWQQCVTAQVCPAANAGPAKGPRDRAPVVNVNWTDALTYTGWLSGKTGRTYRLPTEAEWEYAARAGSTTSRYWGDDRRGQCENANGADLSAFKYDRKLPAGPEPCDDGFVALAPTGSLAPNGFKLYDMAGNAWEWTLDCWTDNYSKAPADGAAVDAPDCKRRVIRGGSWRTKPESLRSANRGLSPEDFRGEDLGFRVVAQ